MRKLLVLVLLMLITADVAGGELPSMIDDTPKEFLSKFPLWTPKAAVIDRYGTPTMVIDGPKDAWDAVEETLLYYDSTGTQTYTFTVKNQKIWDVKIDDSNWWNEKGSAREYQDAVLPITKIRIRTAFVRPAKIHPITLQVSLGFIFSILLIGFGVYHAAKK